MTNIIHRSLKDVKGTLRLDIQSGPTHYVISKSAILSHRMQDPNRLPEVRPQPRP